MADEKPVLSADTRVTIGAVAAVVSMLAVCLIWAFALRGSVDALTKEITELKDANKQVTADVRQMGEKIVDHEVRIRVMELKASTRVQP